MLQPAKQAEGPATASVRRHGIVYRWLARWTRWLHIYLSLAFLAAILFFSLTGLTLNHPDWFFSESTVSSRGQLDVAWLHLAQQAPSDWDQSDYSHQIDRLAVAEFLRSQHSLRGSVGDFLAFADECEVTFEGPGYAATARIRRDSGDYQLDVTTNDLVSILNDLHKGRHTTPAWKLFIDVSAILSALVAVTGFLLVFFLKINRRRRIALVVFGTIVLISLAAVAG